MKTSKRFLALVLSALMIFSVVIIPGVDMSMFGIEADAAEDAEDAKIDKISQTRIVPNYASTYAGYQSMFFGDSSTNWPTNFVIPGLTEADNYTPQGMTYWKEKEWILISAYYAGTQPNETKDKKASVIYALDAVTTKFVALYYLYDGENTPNTSHGGGIAASEYNFYYADGDSKISYIPLEDMDILEGTSKILYLKDSIDCSGELWGAKTSYCCYDDGVLWAGNFYLADNESYGKAANSAYNSMLVGYKLQGNSSDEEWYNLQDKNMISPNTTGNINTKGSGGDMSYSFTVNENGYFDIKGSVSNGTGNSADEITSPFGVVTLYHGYNYTLEFDISENIINNYDMYLLRDGSIESFTHINEAKNGDLTVTKNDDGTWHCKLDFTPGQPVKNATGNPIGQCNWHSNVSDASGNYTIRFDQDAPNGAYDFEINNIHIYERDERFTTDTISATNCAGNPTYAIAFDNLYNKIQYAMVDKGKIYISRSWNRDVGAGTHTRALAISDLDIYAPGTKSLTVNNRVRDCHFVAWSMDTQFGLDNNKTVTAANPKGDNVKYTNKDFMAMGEALCVIEDYLYMFAESAAYAYYGDGKTGGDGKGSCSQPIDVIWKIDQHKINNVPRPAEEVQSIYYEKVSDISEIRAGEAANTEYIIVFESKEKDPVTQKPILYAIDSFGGYGGAKLPKKEGRNADDTNITRANTLDSMGLIGYPITEYSTGISDDGSDVIYLNETDDSKKSIRWTITKDTAPNGEGSCLLNSDYYYGNNRYLCYTTEVFTMNQRPEYIGISGSNGNFTMTSRDYTVWCNPGYTPDQLKEYTDLYQNYEYPGYTPVYHGLEEVKGTFHIAKSDDTDAKNYNTMHIYKRVKDPYASTYGTDVFTDLNAELKPDGTYTVNLETYATSAVQYMKNENIKATDFIFVLDNSTKMNEPDADGFYSDSTYEWLGLHNLVSNTDNLTHGKADVPIYDCNYTLYFKHDDGRYYPFEIVIKDTDNKSGCDYLQFYWVYYKVSENEVYLLTDDNGWYNGKKSLTFSDLKNKVNTNADNTASFVTSAIDNKTNACKCDHYRISAPEGKPSRMQVARDFITEMTYQIAEANSEHRVSLITYGNPANSYLIDDNGTESIKTALDTNGDKSISNEEKNEFNNAFYANSEFGAFRKKVAEISASATSAQPSVGLSRAANTVEYSDEDYTITGNRNAVVFLITGADNLDETTANNGIAKAFDAKKYGGFVYTVKIGSTKYDTDYTSNLLNYASSNYINATSIETPGEANQYANGFTLEIPTDFSKIQIDDSSETIKFRAFAESLVTKTTNNVLSYVRFNKASFIREDLGQFFNMNSAQFSYKSVEADYDGLGRLYFKEETIDDVSGLTATLTNNNRTVEVKGFDFSSHYVSTANIGKDKAEKFIVSISGLTLNSTVDNETVTNDEKTGLYLGYNNIKWKGYPTDYVNVPEYTYVLDYGIGMLDTDVNGEIQSISVLPNKQETYSTTLPDPANGKNNVTITTKNSGKHLVYGLLPDNMGVNNAGYCLIKRPDFSYDWFKINVVPASNVYFEETAITLPEGSDWTASTTSNEISQDLTNENDVYGYDKGYLKDGNGFSNGTVYTSFVNDSKLRSDTLKFDYTGTAIDLYGSCGPDTGIYIVTIKNGDSIEKVYITDTYFSDTDILGDNDRLNQVPFVHHENKDQYGGPMYGKHTVEITSVYLNSIVGQRGAATFGLRDNVDTAFDAAAFEEDVIEAILMYAEMEELMDENIEISFCDENSVLNGGEGADVATTFGFFTTGANTSASLTNLTNYFDGFRTYQPAGLGAADGMYPDSEQGARYYNVMKNLVSGSAITSGATNLNGIAYLEKDASAEDTITFADYDKKGPKNELYLNPGNAISFNLKFDGETITPNSKAMISLRTVNGEAKVVINGKEYTINNTMEMYYRIDEIPADGLVYIQNTSAVDANGNGSLVAIDTLKITNGVMAPMMMSAMPRISMMMSAPPTPSEPNAPETEEIPEIPTPEAPPVVEPLPEEPSNEPEDGEDNNEEKGFFEQITEKFTEVLNMIQSMLDKIVNLLKSIMA